LDADSRSRILFAAAVVAAALIFCAGFLSGIRFKPSAAPDAQLVTRVNRLDAELNQLRRVEISPAEIVRASRDSICFIVSTFSLSDPLAPSSFPVRYRVLASGFVISHNTVVSNRHVLEPWFGDDFAERAIRMGAVPRRGKILAYFPDQKQPFELSDILVSHNADVGVAHLEAPHGIRFAPLQLSTGPVSPGDPVVVMGYPLGVTTMLAKGTAVPYEISALRQDDEEVEHLAKFELIRPTATQGHLADAAGTTLIYDATTAHGSSGGPVFNREGEVIGVNAALINGFSGTSLGVSSSALSSLLNSAPKR
jgi:S1-C subfamily serine protease